MPDLLSVSLQDILHSRKSELRKGKIIDRLNKKLVSSDSRRCLLYVKNEERKEA